MPNDEEIPRPQEHWGAGALGGVAGLAVVAAAWAVQMQAEGLAPSQVLELHMRVPMMVFVDFAPLYLAALVRSVARLKTRPVPVAVVAPVAGQADVQEAADPKTVIVPQTVASDAEIGLITEQIIAIPTPVNAMLGNAELLLEELEQLDRPDLLHLVKEVRAGGRHLQAVVGNVLEMARMRDGSVSVLLEPVTVGEVVDDTVGAVRAVAEALGVSVSLDLPDRLDRARADAAHIRQVLINLLHNALKHTQGSSIRIEVDRETFSGAEHVVFRVLDNGPGLDEEELAALTRELEAAESGQPTELVRLGLAVSAGLSKLMGGSLSVESHRGEGTAFCLRVVALGRRRVAEPPRESTVPPEEFDAEFPIRIVVCGDEALAQTIHEGFAANQVRVLAYDGADQALAGARSIHPTAIVLGVGERGLALLRKLRVDTQIGEVPTVLLSEDEAEERAAYGLGCTDFAAVHAPGRLIAVLSHCHEPDPQPRFVVLSQRPSLRSVLRASGWTAVRTDDVDAAFKLIGSNRPDAVIVDLELVPEPEVRRIAAVMRGNPAWRSTLLLGLARTGGEAARLDTARRLLAEVVLADGESLADAMLGVLEQRWTRHEMPSEPELIPKLDPQLAPADGGPAIFDAETAAPSNKRKRRRLLQK